MYLGKFCLLSSSDLLLALLLKRVKDESKGIQPSRRDSVGTCPGEHQPGLEPRPCGPRSAHLATISDTCLQQSGATLPVPGLSSVLGFRSLFT